MDTVLLTAIDGSSAGIGIGVAFPFIHRLM